MNSIIGTVLTLICKIILFAIFAFAGIKIGIALRNKKNKKENVE